MAEHHIVLWDHQQMAATDKPHDPYIMRACGWMCATCRTWAAEESPKRREHAIERHVTGMRSDTATLERLIERWWEEEADDMASCPAPNHDLCRRHVFEEAVRVDGEIVACTVHGGKLARSLAAFLDRDAKETQAKLEALATAAQAGARRAHRERYPVRLFEVNHPEAFLLQPVVPPIREAPPVLSTSEEPVGRVTEETFRREREGTWPPPVPPPGMPPRPDLDSVARQAHAQMDGDDAEPGP